MVSYAVADARALYFAIKRDLRRAALFLWMTPLLATRSSTLTASTVAACAASASPAAIATSAFLINVRASVRSGLLRSRRRSEMRIRFFDDFELANCVHPSLQWWKIHDHDSFCAHAQDSLSYQTARPGSTRDVPRDMVSP